MKHPSPNPKSWQDAWNASPGPKTKKDSGILFLKGICMGAADIIPGVSGGTIAFITGIYSQWLEAIASVNLIFVKKFFRFDWKGALAEVHVRFIVPLLFGIALAIVSVARVMNYLISSHAVLTWSLFFGLILASIYIVSKEVKRWRGSTMLFVVAGAVGAYWVVGLIPVATPETWWFLLFSGMIAICAMVLPGLSGAFILLVLGKYEFVTGALKNPFALENLFIIFFFVCGCLIGIIGFSRLLKFFLEHYHDLTLALLTGVMVGAMRKIWPWKEVLETKIIRGKTHVLQEQNVLPSQLDSQVFWAVLLMLVGIAFVFFLDKFSRPQTS